MRCCWLDLQQVAGHRILSLQRIPLPFCTNDARKAVVHPHRPLVKGIPPHTGKWQPITNFSVSNLQIIASATKVKVIQWPISSTTSAPGIPASQTHLHTMNHGAQTWSTRKLVPGRPGIEYLGFGTQPSVDWRIGLAFSSLTASSRHLCSNSSLIVLRTVFNTELVFAWLRTSSPSSTCFWTSLAPVSVIFSSSMISFSGSNVNWADALIFQHSSISLQC